jgi:predicted nucleotidyltransferase
MQCAEIVIDNHVSGKIEVCYTQKVFEGEHAFLQEEQKLLNAIAEHLSRYLFHRRLKKTLEQAAAQEGINEPSVESSLLTYESDEHWKWRLNICEKIARMLDMERLGVEAVYVIGSTKNASAGPGSDIDLLVHFSGTAEQANELRAWTEGWGLGLAELNFLKTGYATIGSLIDLHIITNEDIRKGDSYAAMIGATDNSARLLRSRK